MDARGVGMHYFEIRHEPPVDKLAGALVLHSHHEADTWSPHGLNVLCCSHSLHGHSRSVGDAYDFLRQSVRKSCNPVGASIFINIFVGVVTGLYDTFIPS